LLVRVYAKVRVLRDAKLVHAQHSAPEPVLVIAKDPVLKAAREVVLAVVREIVLAVVRDTVQRVRAQIRVLA